MEEEDEVRSGSSVDDFPSLEGLRGLTQVANDNFRPECSENSPIAPSPLFSDIKQEDYYSSPRVCSANLQWRCQDDEATISTHGLFDLEHSHPFELKSFEGSSHRCITFGKEF